MHATLARAEAHSRPQHTVSVAHKLVLLLQLPEDIALLVEHVFLPRLRILSLHELPLLQIGLAVLALKLLPESWVMRVTLPLLGQLLDLLFSNLTVISLNQLCLHLSALDARLGCLGAEDSGEVWNVARALVSLQVNVLAEATALTAIFPLVVLSTAHSDLHL